jgi:Tol biopolymer transport system component
MWRSHPTLPTWSEGTGTASPNVFVRDLVTGTTVRASVDTGGGDPNERSSSPSLSADGRHLAFESRATDLVQRDGNRFIDAFVRDLVAGTTERASVDAGGGEPNHDIYGPSISANGRYVAFWSFATDLIPRDRNASFDVFIRALGRRH